MCYKCRMKNRTLKFIGKQEHLLENSLGEALSMIFTDSEIIRNKPFLGKTRPDFRIDDFKLIVEFDGPRHFTDPAVLLRDQEKDAKFIEAGYKVVRIPYFLQLRGETILAEFGEYFEILGIDFEFSDFTNYPHGFIHDKVVLPAAFCQLGTMRFRATMNYLTPENGYDKTVQRIYESLEVKMLKHKSVRKVICIDDDGYLNYLFNNYSELRNEISDIKEKYFPKK